MAMLLVLNHSSSSVINDQISVVNMWGHCIMASRNTSIWGCCRASEAGGNFLSAQTGARISLNTSPGGGVTGLHGGLTRNFALSGKIRPLQRLEVVWQWLNVVQMSYVLMWEVLLLLEREIAVSWNQRLQPWQWLEELHQSGSTAASSDRSAASGSSLLELASAPRDSWRPQRQWELCIADYALFPKSMEASTALQVCFSFNNGRELA